MVVAASLHGVFNPAVGCQLDGMDGKASRFVGVATCHEQTESPLKKTQLPTKINNSNNDKQICIIQALPYPGMSAFCRHCLLQALPFAGISRQKAIRVTLVFAGSAGVFTLPGARPLVCSALGVMSPVIVVCNSATVAVSIACHEQTESPQFKKHNFQQTSITQTMTNKNTLSRHCLIQACLPFAGIALCRHCLLQAFQDKKQLG